MLQEIKNRCCVLNSVKVGLVHGKFDSYKKNSCAKRYQNKEFTRPKMNERKLGKKSVFSVPYHCILIKMFKKLQCQ